MTTFRAVVLSTQYQERRRAAKAKGDAGAKVEEPSDEPSAAEKFDATVAFVEVGTDGTTREIDRQRFTVASREELTQACIVVLTDLRAKLKNAQLAIDLTGTTLAEIEV